MVNKCKGECGRLLRSIQNKSGYCSICHYTKNPVEIKKRKEYNLLCQRIYKAKHRKSKAPPKFCLVCRKILAERNISGYCYKCYYTYSPKVKAIKLKYNREYQARRRQPCTIVEKCTIL
jgi:hypothetical protein